MNQVIEGIEVVEMVEDDAYNTQKYQSSQKQVNSENENKSVNNLVISSDEKLLSTNNTKPTKLSIRLVTETHIKPNFEKIKNIFYTYFTYCYEKASSGITRKNQPDVLGYLLMTSLMYYIGSYVFSTFNILFCIGIAYIGAIDYYNQNTQTKIKTEQNIKSIKNNDGLVSLCSIIIFDGILDYVSSFQIPIISYLSLVTRISLHLFYCEFFVNFMTNNKSLIDNTNSEIEPLYQQNGSYTINNFFQSLFTDMIICNNIVCQKVCVEYNIYCIMSLMQPINLISRFDYKSTYDYVKNMISRSKNNNDDLHVR